MEATTDYKTLYEQQLKSNAHLQLQLSQLSHQLQELQRLIFGSRHERFAPENNNPNQLHLDLSTEAIGAAGVVDTKQVSYTRSTSEITEGKSHPVCLKLPDHLLRKEVILEPGVDVSGLRRLGKRSQKNWIMNPETYL
jgi:transposase